MPSDFYLKRHSLVPSLKPTGWVIQESLSGERSVGGSALFDSIFFNIHRSELSIKVNYIIMNLLYIALVSSSSLF